MPPGDSVQQGFTLLETVIALLLMLIVALGSASLFSFSIYNNSGGSDRAVAVATAQQAFEILRTAPFSTANTDVRLNAGTFVQNNVYVNQRYFKITKIITDKSPTLKSITITVQSQSIVKGWASGAGGTVTLMTQRTRAD
ncbi:MAG: prepilin-type N-terminal cleavage/methylation domain-containing protein [Pyrinomonadaceae bacterium]